MPLPQGHPLELPVPEVDGTIWFRGANAFEYFDDPVKTAENRPRSVDFMPELPRSETGKRYLRVLRDSYWAGHGTSIL